MTIKIFPSLMPGEPIEQHDFHGGSIGQWLESQGIRYSDIAEQPIQVSVDGAFLPVEAWKTTIIGKNHQVEVRILPRGGVFNALSSIIRKLDPVLNWFLKGMSPKTANNSQQSGLKLESVEASANEATLGAVVPELAGRFRRFPDYLVPPRRYFASPREQWLEFLCCIGPGQYQVADADVKVGDTPFSSLGADAEYGIYPPGAGLSAIAGHEHWHTVDEVGATSSGTAGLELSSAPSSDITPNATGYNVEGVNVEIVGDDIPDGWGVGTLLALPIARDYVVTMEEGPGFPDPILINRFTGNFREIGPSIGKAIRFTRGSTTRSAKIGAFSVDLNGDGWVELLDNSDAPISDVPLGGASMHFYIEGRLYRVVAILALNQVQVVANKGGSMLPVGQDSLSTMDLSRSG